MTIEDECIEWDGPIQQWDPPRFYGLIYENGTVRRAHRVVWEEENGPIPDGLFVLHRCDNPPCINIDHLFLGTHNDNVQDMVAKGRHWQQRKTHCPQGHEYSEKNTWTNKKGWRYCRSCAKDRREAKGGLLNG